MTIQQETILKSVFTLAHEKYEKGLSARAYFKVNDRMLAEDLVQKTFIKTWNYLIKGGKIEMMKAFLYHILNNLIVDEYRKHKTTSLDILLEKGYEPGFTDAGRIFNIFDGRSASKLIERLPLKYQKVLTMRYLEERTLEEISTELGQSKNTIAVQVHRGLEKLKILYEAR